MIRPTRHSPSTRLRSLAPLALIAAIVAADPVVIAAPVSPTVPGVQPLPIARPVEAGARTLRVGASAEYATPGAAAMAAREGDTIEIAPGDYRGDAAIWTAHRLRIVGGEPRPHLHADGRDAEGKAIWVVRGDDITIENIEMSGARVFHRNGAAIRAEGTNLTLRNCYLHDNENGLLSSPNPTSEITIEHSEFARNGGGEGMTHNLYIGVIARLIVRQSYFHHAIAGHNLKSRAASSMITDSRFADEVDGSASYEAEFPNGGQVTLGFNIFQKGANAENGTLVSYGAEGLAPGGNHVLVARGNTFISQRGGSRFLYLAPDIKSANLIGNIFAGPGTLPDIAGIRANNAVQRDMPGNLNLRPF